MCKEYGCNELFVYSKAWHACVQDRRLGASCRKEEERDGPQGLGDSLMLIHRSMMTYLFAMEICLSS